MEDDEMATTAPTRSKDDRVTRVGVIGLGHMGDVFARNLMETGYQVSVFDRQAERRASLVEAGARAMESLADTSGLEAVITSLPNDEAVTAVALGEGGLVATLDKGAVHISMSTISPGLSRRLAQQHANAGQGFAAAPVLGNPDLARARGLFGITSGVRADVEKVTPLLGQLTQRVFYLSEDAGAADLMKLAGNALTAITMQSLGEVFALLRKQGVDPHQAFEVLTGSLFDGKVHKAYGGKIVDERYLPAGMAAVMAAKDLRLVLAEAETARVPMPAVGLVHDRIVAVMARGWSDLDWSALGLLAAAESGLESAMKDLPAPASHA
jgi:3-hydroxyisobutyrate dehydrogenase-like beta-hydroxyacid dehydrogenase